MKTCATTRLPRRCIPMKFVNSDWTILAVILRATISSWSIEPRPDCCSPPMSSYGPARPCSAYRRATVTRLFSGPSPTPGAVTAGGTPRDAWAWIRQHGAPDVIFLTRLAVTYDILDQHDIEEFVQFARAGSIPVILDDAGGGRVGPVCFGQPRSLELGVDVAVTGLDKYGVLGPRLGLVGGDATIVASIRSRAYEMGLEARQALLPAVAHSLRSYSDSAVRDRVEITQRVVRALAQRLGDDLARSNEIIGFLPAEEIMRAVRERAGTDKDFQIVPYEATAALAMVLLRDYGIMTVHFAGVPPGTADLLIKFLPPDTVARFGGPDALAEAFDRSLDHLGDILPDREVTRKLLFDPAC